jgi:CubicO group peptidase (beta-lactamase class C family)
VPALDPPALRLVADWPVPNAAAGYVAPDGAVRTAGDADRPFALASVTKLLATMAVLVAVEEGSVALDEPVPVDAPGEVTVRHLLAHTSGLSFDGTGPVARPGRRRIYSNAGIERLADHVAERSGVAFADYLTEGVLVPLGMGATSIGDRSPAAGAIGPLADVLRFGAECLAPTLVAPATLADATSVQFPGLDGVVPGIGRMSPCDWGLGFELRDGKSPHWTGTANSPATFGHFGGSGTFLWVDPVAGVACAGLTDRDFDTWAMAAWPALSDAVLAEVRAPG